MRQQIQQPAVRPRGGAAWSRRQNGFSLVEAAATISVMIPMLIAVVLVVSEISEAYRIKMALVQAARQAAHDMAVAYGKTPLLEGNKVLQDNMVYDKVRVSNVIVDSTQFALAEFDTSSTPPLVRVTNSYISDSTTNLPKFPSFDPLNLGSNFQLNAEATYPLD
jgi:hypothetical protein